MAENLRFNLEIDNTSAVGSINDFFATFEQGAAKAKSTLNTAFGQGLQTEIKIDFKNGEVVAKQVQSINQESKKLGDIYNAVNGAIGKTPNELKKQLSILNALRGDVQKFENGTKNVTKDWQILTQKIKEAKDALNLIEKGSTFQQITASIQGLAGQFALVQTLSNAVSNALQGVASGAANFLKTGADLEVLNINLVAFTGSTQGAKDALATFQRVAEQTTFNFQQVSEAGKIMLGFGMTTEQTKTSVKQLAVVASVTGSDLSLMARNLGQVSSQGRAFTRDLNQFATAGIPIFQTLSLTMGKSQQAIRKLAEEGKIGFPEVEKALRELTKEGSAFSEASKELENTWVGKLEKIASAVQNFALAFVKTATDIDAAFGRPVAKVLQLVADGINLLAANWQKVISAVIAAGMTYLAFAAIAKLDVVIAGTVAFGKAIWAGVQALRALKAATVAQTLAQVALSVAQAVSAALTGNWAGIAAGALIAGAAIGIFAGSYAFLNRNLEENARKQAESNAQTAGAVTDVNGLTQAQIDLANAAGNTDLTKQYTQALAAQEGYKQALDAEIQKLQDIKTAVNEKYDEEKRRIQEKIESKNEELRIEQENLKTIKDALKDRYDQEKLRLDEKYNAVARIYDLEIAALEQLSPAEQALAALRRQELVDKIASGTLTQKEALEAQAQLDRMDRQAKIAVLRAQKEAELNKIKEEQKKIDDDHDAAKKAADDASETRQKRIRDEVKVYKDELKAVEIQQAEINKVIDKSIKVNGELIKTLDEIPKIVKAQTDEVWRAKTAYDNAARSANDLAAAIERKNAAEANKPASQRANPPNAINVIRPAAYQSSIGVRGVFTGGPVVGGQKYTVNELGQEAFLSAGGKLSMINAPAWGTWKPPSAGTVIPAHLTSQLDIPSGGINLNSAARVSVARVSNDGNSTGRMLKALQGLSGANDNIVNNVTIQSDNTTQAASDILVQLTKIRRRRYS